jgi:hypothetical protein
MKEEYLKLAGRVVSVNAADQSVLIESTESPNRFRVYANNKLFKRIDHVLTISWFNGGKSREVTGTFYIQGKVLIHFIKEGSTFWGDMLQAANAWANREDQSK